MHDMQEDFLRAAGSNRAVAAGAICKKGQNHQSLQRWCQIARKAQQNDDKDILHAFSQNSSYTQGRRN
jgi:hypothetical protein